GCCALQDQKMAAASASKAPNERLYYKLYEACGKGDYSRVRGYLSEGLSPGWINKNDRNRSLLMAAAASTNGENVNICRLLTELKSPLDHRDSSGLGALHICARQNLFSVAKLLLNAGANVNLLAKNDVTALMICVDFGHIELAKLLLDQRNIQLNQQSSQQGFTALMKSVFENSVQLACLLIDRGARLDLASKSGFTALHLCAQLDRREIAKRILAKAPHELVNRTARPEFKSSTAFALAALNGHVEMLRLLHASGADPNLVNSEGCTALDQVKMAGVPASPELLSLLKSWRVVGGRQKRSKQLSLIKAIRSDRLDRVRNILLNDGEGVNQAIAMDRTTGQTPLMLAAGLDKPEALKLLLEAIRRDRSSNASLHVNLRSTNSSQTTALHAAVQAGSEACVSQLLHAGAKLSIRDAWGSTPLHFCADFDSARPLVKLLVSRAGFNKLMNSGGGGRNGSPLCPVKLAAVRGHLDVLRPMLRRLLQLDAQWAGNEWLPQICDEAKRARQLDAVNVVLELMSKSTQNTDELTISKVFKAAMDGNTRKVRYLLESSGGALQRRINERIRQDPGWTVLMAATWNDDEATCRLLLDRGADPNVAQQDLGVTALHIAVQQDSRRVAKILLDQTSIDINAKSSDSRTPLIRAAWLNRRAIAILLLDRRASVNNQEADGFSALHFCAQENLQELAELLIKRNANLELETSSRKNRNTAFTLAAVKGHADMLKLLANYGASIYHRSSQGDAMELAMRANRTAATEVLLQLDSQKRRTWAAHAAPTSRPARRGRRLDFDFGGTHSGRFELFEPDYSSQNSSVVPPIRGYQYTMRSKPRGICLIINNEKFVDDSQTRTGSQQDVNRLESLFRETLNFEVQVHRDNNANELLALVRKLATSDRHTKFDCFVAFIMSHGKYDKVLGSDGNYVELDDVISPFYDCRSLQNKPKLFFIQGCRIIEGSRSSSGSQSSVQLLRSSQYGRVSSSKMDFLIAYAVTKGDKAIRITDKGSPYIQTLCNVIRRNYERSHLCAMLNMVRHELGRRPFFAYGPEFEPIFNLPSEINQLRATISWSRVPPVSTARPHGQQNLPSPLPLSPGTPRVCSMTAEFADEQAASAVDDHIVRISKLSHAASTLNRKGCHELSVFNGHSVHHVVMLVSHKNAVMQACHVVQVCVGEFPQRNDELEFESQLVECSNLVAAGYKHEGCVAADAPDVSKVVHVCLNLKTNPTAQVCYSHYIWLSDEQLLTVARVANQSLELPKASQLQLGAVGLRTQSLRNFKVRLQIWKRQLHGFGQLNHLGNAVRLLRCGHLLGVAADILEVPLANVNSLKALPILLRQSGTVLLHVSLYRGERQLNLQQVFFKFVRFHRQVISDILRVGVEFISNRLLQLNASGSCDCLRMRRLSESMKSRNSSDVAKSSPRCLRCSSSRKSELSEQSQNGQVGSGIDVFGLDSELDSRCDCERLVYATAADCTPVVNAKSTAEAAGRSLGFRVEEARLCKQVHWLLNESRVQRLRPRLVALEICVFGSHTRWLTFKTVLESRQFPERSLGARRSRYLARHCFADLEAPSGSLCSRGTLPTSTNSTNGQVEKWRLPRRGTAQGSKTSEYYAVQNIPDRFDNPDWFKGYGNVKPVHPMYRTTASDYGKMSPTVHTMPTTFHPVSQTFSETPSIERNVQHCNCDSIKRAGGRQIVLFVRLHQQTNTGARRPDTRHRVKTAPSEKPANYLAGLVTPSLLVVSEPVRRHCATASLPLRHQQHQQQHQQQQLGEVPTSEESALPKTAAKEEKVKSLTSQLESRENEVASLERNLANTRSELAAFKARLDERVRLVDEKYKARMATMRLEAVDLRKAYITKCEQLVESRKTEDTKLGERVYKSKEIMRDVIKARHRVEVSMAALDPSEEDLPPMPFDRRFSQPTTVNEHSNRPECSNEEVWRQRKVNNASPTASAIMRPALPSAISVRASSHFLLKKSNAPGTLERARYMPHVLQLQQQEQKQNRWASSVPPCRSKRSQPTDRVQVTYQVNERPPRLDLGQTNAKTLGQEDPTSCCPSSASLLIWPN
uniref:ANK_REP_REGION domain-containing protein n=1 Tax=Macrostomum lignano TaxID=282301 RepID=A0A1I8I0Q1_9PLAT